MLNLLEREALGRVTCQQGDITHCEVDVIVNAANSSLMGGGGVDGAIHRAAGAELLEACLNLVPRGCETGGARLTPGFRLPASFVIHTVGPIYSDGTHGEADLLASCYAKSVAIAAQNDCHSMAFPAISCGVYRFPLAAASEIAFTTLAKSLTAHLEIDRVSMVLFGDHTHQVFMDTHKRLMS
ncbi:MAG: O-acetyl-ADP-ribose deacetylase (regulator of RNase III) [Planctomycetota bacterium]|jgi:O-acetyl-ADP-ribose deacetylase (regulator of RNase III)